MMITNFVISLYITAVSLYFRHSIYHVVAIYITSSIILLDFTKEHFLYSILPSIIICVIYLSKYPERRCECIGTSLSACSLRPLLFLLASYRIFDMSSDVPLGAIRTIALSYFILTGLIAFDNEFTDHFKYIRHIFISYSILIVILHGLHSTIFVYLGFVAISELLPLLYLYRN